MNGVNPTTIPKSQPTKPTITINATGSSMSSSTTPKVASSTASPVANGPTRSLNGDTAPATPNKGKKPATVTIDPSEVHEMVQNRIAALEGEKVQGGEEDKRSAEEARKITKGMTFQQLHTKYIELYQDFRRQDRDHAKERQKNKKEADASKTALTNVQKLKAKTDAVVRDMQKQNKDLREEVKRLKTSLQQVDVQDLHSNQTSLSLLLNSAKEELQRRLEREKRKEKRYVEMPDIVIKVICRLRAELFFKISRKTKLARLFSAWTERMEARPYIAPLTEGQKSGDGVPKIATPAVPTMQFIFTHMGRTLEPEQTPEDACMEDGDEILAVESIDLTGPEVKEISEEKKEELKKKWTKDPVEARHSIEEIFDGIVRERLKDLLRQYELREKHFDAIIRSKELEVMLARARTQDAKLQLDRDMEALVAVQQRNNDLIKNMDEMQTSHQELVDQFLIFSTEFLSAIKSEGQDGHESMDRALQEFESLRNQMSSPWGLNMLEESTSEVDPTASAG